MRLILLLSSLLIAGCAPSFGLVKAQDISTMNVHWNKGSSEICGKAETCTQSWPGRCVITMREDSPDWVVAHEFRHCFGYAHEK